MNIGDPEKQQEYLKKYQEIDAALPQLLGNLATLARANVHLPQDLQAKADGPAGPLRRLPGRFLSTPSGRLKADPNLTPQQANALMAKFKADIPVLETDMAAVAEAVDRMEISVSARAVKRARDARMFIAVAVLAALVLAGPVGRGLVPFHLPGRSSGKGYAAWPTGYEGESRRVGKGGAHADLSIFPLHPGSESRSCGQAPRATWPVMKKRGHRPCGQVRLAPTPRISQPSCCLTHTSP